MSQAATTNISKDSLAVSDSDATKFERGFKSWSENTSLQLRGNLGLASVDPMPPRLLADYLGAFVLEPSDIPDIPADTLRYLTSAEGDEWSAVTVRAAESDIIILNPNHSLPRQASDLMHELAHILRRHEPAQIVISAETGVGLRTFNVRQEAEANWLAGALLLPREALAHCCARGNHRSEISERFGVSEELLRYRMNVTGVGRQFRA